MSSAFLSSGFDPSVLEDGSLAFFGASLGSTNLIPTFPIKVNADQQLVAQNLEISDVNDLETRLDGYVANPFPGTVSAQNFITAYDTTPLNINTFITTTVNDISDLNSNTQYVTATLGNTNIASNISTNDVNVTSLRNLPGSTFIDMTDPTDISVNATNFDFNGNAIATTATLAGYLTNPSTATLNMGTHAISGVTTLNGTTVSNLVQGPVSASNNNLCSFDLTTGKIIKDSMISATSVTGGPFLPINGLSPMTGDLSLGTHAISGVTTLNGKTVSNLVIGGPYLPIDGSSAMTGNLAMGTNAINGSGANTAGSLTLSTTTDSTSSSTGALVDPGGMGITKRLNVGGDCAIGVNRATSIANLEVVGSTGLIVSDGAAAASVKKFEVIYDTTNNRTNIQSVHTGTATTPIVLSCANLGFNNGSFGGARGVIALPNAGTVPSSASSSGGLLFAYAGVLYWKGGVTTTVLAPN